MLNVDLFGDERKVPKLSVNVKVKVKTESQEENTQWNSVFGYLMKKPRTKLDFLTTNNFRKLPLAELTLEKLKPFIFKEDYDQLVKIERVFNEALSSDLKAFILAILKIPYEKVLELKETD